MGIVREKVWAAPPPMLVGLLSAAILAGGKGQDSASALHTVPQTASNPLPAPVPTRGALSARLTEPSILFNSLHPDASSILNKKVGIQIIVGCHRAKHEILRCAQDDKYPIWMISMDLVVEERLHMNVNLSLQRQLFLR